MKSKIGIIGNKGDGSQVGGQITKTNEVIKYLENRYESINELNVYGNNFFLLLFNIIYIMRNSENVIIILASTGYFKILPLIIGLKKIFNCKIHEIVIGGVRQDYVRDKKIRIFLEKRVDYIYLESTYMVNEYKKIGLENGIYMPNFKSFDVTKFNNKQNDSKQIRLCTFSRIDQYKGIDTAIQIVESLNKELVGKYKLDIYGPVDKAYKEEFENLISQVDERFICYRGAVKTEEAQQILVEYDLLLFPTHWDAEGLPGTFIDALSAGLPIIASKKENFRDAIKDGYNGYLIDEYDINGFCKVIGSINNDKHLLNKLKENALSMAEEFSTDIVLKKLII